MSNYDDIDSFNDYAPNPSETEHFDNHPNVPGPSEEGFSNMNMDMDINVDKVLKAVFFGAIFYLLSQPELYKITKKQLGSIDGVLLHSIVFSVLYLVLNMFIS